MLQEKYNESINGREADVDGCSVRCRISGAGADMMMLGFQVAQRVFFLHEELTKLPAFPRKALETDFHLYKGGHLGNVTNIPLHLTPISAGYGNLVLALPMTALVLSVIKRY